MRCAQDVGGQRNSVSKTRFQDTVPNVSQHLGHMLMLWHTMGRMTLMGGVEGAYKQKPQEEMQICTVQLLNTVFVKTSPKATVQKQGKQQQLQHIGSSL